MHELNRVIADAAGRKPELVDLPDFVGNAISKLGFLPGMPITRDQWIMLQKDNVASGPGLEAFGIQPTPLAAVAPEWLDRFNEGGRFASRRAQASAG
jgi:NADH dehydrogenase